MKIKKPTIMFYRPIQILLVILYFATILNAQERATQAPEVQSFFLSPDLEGVAQNSVNMFTGDVSLPINLLSIQGRGGLAAGVTASYSSNIQHQRDIWALEAPTSILGLGWSMDYDKIVVDHKNTGTIHDDDFYLISGGSSNELIMTDHTAGIRTFEPKSYQPWKITYHKWDERWEIIKEDGTTYVFGGGVHTIDGNKTSQGNSVQWGVKWGNWIGSSMRTSGQQQHAIAWNLSNVRNTWGDELSYEYLAVEEKVGRYAEPDHVEPKKHTKASYLQRITTPGGKKVEFVYQNKHPSEYTDPHQELTEPYDIFLEINGPTNINIGTSYTWNAIVGNFSGPKEYTWEFQYFGQSTWYTLQSGASSTLTHNFLPLDNVSGGTLKLKVHSPLGTPVPGPSGETTMNILFISGPGPGPIPLIAAAPATKLNATIHYEPDAYQEKYEDKYLEAIVVFNENDKELYSIVLEYGSYGNVNESTYKRLLSTVTHRYPNGESLPSMHFYYNDENSIHPAALYKAIYPTGVEVDYTYSEFELPNSDRKITVLKPGANYKDPRYFIGNNYVVNTWRNDINDDAIIKVISWDGSWREETLESVIDLASYKDGLQNFEIYAGHDFFVVVPGIHTKEINRNILVFNKGLMKYSNMLQK